MQQVDKALEALVLHRNSALQGAEVAAAWKGRRGARKCSEEGAEGSGDELAGKGGARGGDSLGPVASDVISNGELKYQVTDFKASTSQVGFASHCLPRSARMKV